MHLRMLLRLLEVADTFAALALEEHIMLLLLLAVVTVHAVATSFIAQRIISPLLRAGSPRQNRSLVLWTALIAYQLSLIGGLFEALAMFDGCWVLMIGLPRVRLTHHLQIVEVFVDAGHESTTRHFVWYVLLLLRSLSLYVLLLADYSSERRTVKVVLWGASTTATTVSSCSGLARLAYMLRFVQIIG